MREGGDVTIVTCSMMVAVALGAADELAGEGIEAEVIDLRTLVPLDEKTILDSVAKTGRLLVADEGRLRCGVASEIAATVSEKALTPSRLSPGWPESTRRSRQTRSRRASSPPRRRRSSPPRASSSARSPPPPLRLRGRS